MKARVTKQTIFELLASGDADSITYGESEFALADAGAVTGAPFVENNSGAGVTDAIIFQAPNGDLLLLVTEDKAAPATRYGTYQYRSTDGGDTWSSEGQIDSDSTLRFGNCQAVIVGTDIYCTVFVDPNSDRAAPYKSALYKSADNGANWTDLGDITSTAEATNEVGLAHLGGNNLVVVLRADDQVHTYMRKTTDLGSSWGSLIDITESVGVVNRPRLHFFAEDSGRLYMNGRYWTGTGKNQTVVYYSDDDGDTWSGAFYPDESIIYDAGYCDVLQKADGSFYMLTYEGPSMDEAAIVEYEFSKNS